VFINLKGSKLFNPPPLLVFHRLVVKNNSFYSLTAWDNRPWMWFFLWKEERLAKMAGSLGASTSSGSGSAPTRCSNCHEKDLRVNMLKAQNQLLL
jgi:cytochrome c553